MTKLLLFASVLVSACAADVGTSVDPERGEEVGVVDIGRVTGQVTGASEGRVVLGNDAWLASREITRGRFSFEGVPDGVYLAKLEVAGMATQGERVVVIDGSASVTLSATPLAVGFSYDWERDWSRGGHEQGSLIGSARELLRTGYGIELSDEDQLWSDEHASRLLQAMRAVPQPMSAAYAPIPLAASTWVLSSGGFSWTDEVVHAPSTAFESGRYVAKQLHREIVKHVTDGGRDQAAVNKILFERYGVNAWLFHDAEEVELISMLEDMPEMLRSIPSLKTIIRRSGGAPVRGSIAERYLEIAETAFTIDRSDAQLALVRAKAQFLLTAEQAEALAQFVVLGEGTGLGFEAARPITKVAVRSQDRQVTVELGLTEEASSAKMYLFNGAGRYRMISLDPVAGTNGTLIRGTVALTAAGTWQPDVIVLGDVNGVSQVRDISEAGWRLEVE